jgi:hypothetical protein
MVEETMIVNEAITNNKLARNLTLMGQPRIEVRPSPNSADSTDGGGTLIPDIQWVRNHVEERIVGGGITPGTPPPTGGSGIPANNSITNAMLMNRIVDGPKLFTSSTPNRVLGVLGANSDPQYLLISRSMLEDRIIDASKLMTSPLDNRLLGAYNANGNLEFVRVNNEMLENNIIDLAKMQKDSVGTEQLIDESITRAKLRRQAIIEEVHLTDNSVARAKIQDLAVSNSKLQEKSITGNKMEDEIVLPARTTVAAHAHHSRRAVRNTILSPDAPTDDQGVDGDIWIRYR